jgi:hypothetical protein
MTSAGFELAIIGSERPEAHAVDRAATGIDLKKLLRSYSR